MALCTYCGKHFTPRQKNPGFCSAACNTAYRLSAELIENRMAAFVRDNWTCSDCGRSHCYLEVQHIIGCAEGGSHELENLETLCVTCHDRRHHRKPRQVDTNGRPITKRKQKEAPT